MCFSCFRHSKYHKSIMPPPSFSVIFLMMSTFSRGQLFLVSIFYQLTSEKNEVHTGNLTHCRQTLIKFFVQKHEQQQKKLASMIQVSLLEYSVMFFLSNGKFYSFPHFTVFCSLVCLLSSQSWLLLPTNSRSIYMKMCTVNNILIPESDQHLISPFNVTPESHIKVMRIKEMIIN